jgi:hypothetical protein
MRMSGVGHQGTLFVNGRQRVFGQSDEIITRLLARNVRGFRRTVRRRPGLPPRC